MNIGTSLRKRFVIELIFVNRDTAGQLQLSAHEDEDTEDGDMYTVRQSDALTVKKQFFASIGQVLMLITLHATECGSRHHF